MRKKIIAIQLKYDFLGPTALHRMIHIIKLSVTLLVANKSHFLGKFMLIDIIYYVYPY